MKILKFSLFIAFIFCFSCEDKGYFIICSDCLSDEPVKTNLEIKINTGMTGYPGTVTVYEGNLEDSIVYSVNIVTGPSFEVPVTLNKKFTVTATYDINNSKYIAVDSATPKVKYEKDQCNDPCYFVYDKKIDLRLKYNK